MEIQSGSLAITGAYRPIMKSGESKMTKTMKFFVLFLTFAMG